MKSYLNDYHARTRPAPQPIPQEGRGDLPPFGALIDDGDRVQCHVCGHWYGSLGVHIRMHGHNAESYKAAYGLARTSSLHGPACAEKQRQAAIARHQGELGAEVLKELPPTRRPRGLANRLESRIRMSEVDRSSGNGQ